MAPLFLQLITLTWASLPTFALSPHPLSQFSPCLISAVNSALLALSAHFASDFRPVCEDQNECTMITSVTNVYPLSLNIGLLCYHTFMFISSRTFWTTNWKNLICHSSVALCFQLISLAVANLLCLHLPLKCVSGLPIEIRLLFHLQKYLLWFPFGIITSIKINIKDHILVTIIFFWQWLSLCCISALQHFLLGKIVFGSFKFTDKAN